MSRPLALAFALLAAAGCHGKPSDATCGALGARLVSLAGDALAKGSFDDATRRHVQDQLPAIRESLTARCVDDKWSADARNCMNTAADQPAWKACEARLTQAQRDALERGAAGPASSAP